MDKLRDASVVNFNDEDSTAVPPVGNVQSVEVSIDVDSSSLKAVMSSEKMGSGTSTPGELAAPIYMSDRASTDKDQLLQDVIHQLNVQFSLEEDVSVTAGHNQLATEAMAQSVSENPSDMATKPTAVAAETFPPQPTKSKRLIEENLRSAWVYSNETKSVLASLGPPETRKIYVMPGVLFSADSIAADPVRDLVKKYMGDAEASKRPNATMGIPESEVGLQTLIASHNFRGAVDLTRRLLTNLGQGYMKARTISHTTEYSLKVWTCRFSLLARLGMYSSANMEMELFGNLDTPDLYYEYYPEMYRGRKGSMVPFSMRLLHAELPQYGGHHSITLARLHSMIRSVDQVIQRLETDRETETEAVSSPLKLWKDRRLIVEYAICNCLIRMKEYRLGFESYSRIAKDQPDQSSTVYCTLGRLSVQLGNYLAAVKYFKKFEEVCDTADPHVQVELLFNTGFLCLFQNNYTEALVAFRKALELEPKNVMGINNVSVALLYQGRLGEAIDILEKAVHHDQSALTEGVVTNLATLYELASARSMHRKHSILSLVSQSKGDSFDVSCLKMQS